MNPRLFGTEEGVTYAKLNFTPEVSLALLGGQTVTDSGGFK